MEGGVEWKGRRRVEREEKGGGKGAGLGRCWKRGETKKEEGSLKEASLDSAIQTFYLFIFVDAIFSLCTLTVHFHKGGG